jgi:hypothetical protein
MALIDSFLSKLLPVQTRNKIRISKTIRDYNKCEKEFTLLREKDPNATPVPHIVKQKAIKEYSKRFNIKVFIETGTFLGIMMNSMKNEFEKLYSIELSELLYKRNKDIFKEQKNIEIVMGNSAEVLPIILNEINQACLFWLDGHYSGGITAKANSETPIIRELTTIFNHPVKNHVILIDDARLFIGKRDYPTMEELKELLDKHLNQYHFEIKDDIIIIFRENL